MFGNRLQWGLEGWQREKCAFELSVQLDARLMTTFPKYSAVIVSSHPPTTLSEKEF